MNEPGRPAAPSFGQALVWWLKLGFISFGGPAGQIALMHRELVERRRWISERRFLHALNFCMLLPGPEAQQLATYIGWLMHRTRGGIAAGALVRAALARHPDRPLVDLRRLRPRAGDRRRLLRHQAGGDGARRLRRVSARPARAHQRLALAHRRARAPRRRLGCSCPFRSSIAAAAGARLRSAASSRRRASRAPRRHGSDAAGGSLPAVIDDDTPTPPHARLQPRPLRARPRDLARALGRRHRRARRRRSVPARS